MFIEKFLGIFTENFVQRLVGNIPAGQLRANDALAIDERDVGNERWTDHQAELHEVERVELAGNSYWKGRLKLLDEERDVGVGIDRPFQYFEAFWSKLLLKATQNLSGFLAVRSSGEDESQAQDFAAVAGDQRRFAVRKFDGKFGRFSRNVGGENSGYERERGQNLHVHGEFQYSFDRHRRAWRVSSATTVNEDFSL